MEWKTGELCGQHDYRRFLEDRAGSLPKVTVNAVYDQF